MPAGPASGPDDRDVEDDRSRDDLRDVETGPETGVDPDAPARTLVDPEEPAVEPNEPG